MTTIEMLQHELMGRQGGDRPRMLAFTSGELVEIVAWYYRATALDKQAELDRTAMRDVVKVIRGNVARLEGVLGSHREDRPDNVHDMGLEAVRRALHGDEETSGAKPWQP